MSRLGQVELVRWKPEGTCAEATPFAWASLTILADVLVAWALGRPPSWRWMLAKAAGVYVFRAWWESRNVHLEPPPQP